MKAYLTRRYLFSASHRLHSDKLSGQQNSATYGKCNNPHGHGHNYSLQVTVSGQVDPETGMVCNLADLDDAVERTVLQRFDHRESQHAGRFCSDGSDDRKSRRDHLQQFEAKFSLRSS